MAASPVAGRLLFDYRVEALPEEPPQPARVASYGDFGGPGNPYSPGAAMSGSPTQGGAFSDQQPLGAARPAFVTLAPQADYSPSDLNGGSRGFPPASLTANQTLPRSSSLSS